jgi:hypothetical protein
MTQKTLAGRLWEQVPRREKLVTEWKKGNAMFGKPDWFKAKAIGWGLTPTSWQGWLYTGAWAGAITVPFVMLMSRGLVPEGLVWLGVSVGGLVWDVRNILHAMHPPATAKEDVLYIGDEPGDSTRLATRHYDLRVRG